MTRQGLLCAVLLAALPGAAHAQDGFCAGLRRVLADAPARFASLPSNARIIPGSVQEWHGAAISRGAPPQGSFSAVMVRHDTRREPDPVPRRFAEIAAEVAACLPEATALGTAAAPGGALARWEVPAALITLRRIDSTLAIAYGTVELTLTTR